MQPFSMIVISAGPSPAGTPTPMPEFEPGASEWPARVIRLGPDGKDAGDIPTDRPFGTAAINRLVEEARTPYLVMVQADAGVRLTAQTFRRFVAAAEDTGAPLLHADFIEDTPAGPAEHPTIDYQVGSVRDSFQFGPVTCWSVDALREAVRRDGPLPGYDYAALYDLRLRVSQGVLPVRIPEPLYRCVRRDDRPSGARQFDYLMPNIAPAQAEMEQAMTAHLKRIGAWLPPTFKRCEPSSEPFPVEASVIIPVRNRAKTVAEAARSALAQKTGFEFNVIVVDNHSTDGTTAILEKLAAEEPRLIHLVPPSTGLGIGGCWYHGVSAASCGRYAVQLDSDDLYADTTTLQRIVDKLHEGPYAMVVGAYRTVDFDLNDLPPGIVDHREWTSDNGPNNLLRVNGIGAPRAFDTALLRRVGLPDVSYGEDYAVSLRISREYHVGRIFEPIYLCRRWSGNSDADLPLAVRNRHDIYKDRLRTLEILARQRRNGRREPAAS